MARPSLDASTPDGAASREVAAMAAAWARGECVTAAERIAGRPDLDDEAAIRLIFEEACLRREAGLDVDTSEVVRAHPRWDSEIRDLFECDRILRTSESGVAFPEVGEALGPFLLLAELGRGASGRTYLAAEPGLAGRRVVVKVVPGDQVEHLALAPLRHTHIVPLFSEHAFPERGLRGLCMPDLGGTSLAQILDDLADIPPSARSGRQFVECLDRNTRATPGAYPADSPFRRALEESQYVQAVTWIAACLADALHYAHARGLVHMDVKPSNVLVTRDGQPILLDFHLARGPIRAGEAADDRLGGTLGWMSPEQHAAMEAVARGRRVPTTLDGRSDIYALGLVLFEALSGPGSGHGRHDAKGRLRLSPACGIGLADIVRKCLAPDPRDRYADASILAEDLRRQLNHLPLVGVRNRSPLERWRKWRNRHPGALAWGITGVTVALAVAVAAGTAVVSHRRRADELRIALEEGRYDRQAGRYEEAIRTLRRGLDAPDSLIPVASGLRDALRREIVFSRRKQVADQLHELADLVRFRYGIDPPAPDEARTLVPLCRAVWERRRDLLPEVGPAPDPETERQIRTDMLELAAVWSDLIVGLAPPDSADDAKREALRRIDEATASYGSSLALEGRRAQLLGSPESLPDARGGAPGPRSAWGHYDLGRHSLRSGQLDRAASEFRRALELRPQDFWSNFYQGLCAFRLRHFEDAAAAFRTCIAISPGAAICHYNRGLAYDAMGRAEEAHRDYSRAIELAPGLAAALLNRGILAYKAGRLSEAVADYERALRDGPDRETGGRLRYNLALALLARCDRASALASLDEAARLGSAEAKSLRERLR